MEIMIEPLVSLVDSPSLDVVQLHRSSEAILYQSVATRWMGEILG